jgi:hypothetical protein
LGTWETPIKSEQARGSGRPQLQLLHWLPVLPVQTPTARPGGQRAAAQATFEEIPTVEFVQNSIVHQKAGTEEAGQIAKVTRTMIRRTISRVGAKMAKVEEPIIKTALKKNPVKRENNEDKDYGKPRKELSIDWVIPSQNDQQAIFNKEPNRRMRVSKFSKWTSNVNSLDSRPFWT